MISKALVVGSGAIGLRTALELLRNQCRVVLVSSKHPLDPSTCSVGAGGLWMPFKCDDPRVERWSIQTLDELLLLQAEGRTGRGRRGDNDDSSPSQRRRPRPLVEIVPAITLSRVNDTNDEKPGWTRDPRLSFQTVTPEMLSWQNQVHKLRIPPADELLRCGYKHGWFFKTPIVDSPRMLLDMLTEVRDHPLTEYVNVGHYDHDGCKGEDEGVGGGGEDDGDGGGVEFASLHDMVDEAARRGCDALVNCAGLASRELCPDDGDPPMVAGRGVLLHYDRDRCPRRPEFGGGVGGEGGDGMRDAGPYGDAVILTEEPPWGSPTEPCYLIPRGDILAVGGSYLEDDTERGIRPQERARLERNAYLLGIDTEAGGADGRSIGEWTGFRPVRPSGVRLEVDGSIGGDAAAGGGLKVVHNFGHGGSGWTVFVGAAKEVAKLLGF